MDLCEIESITFDKAPEIESAWAAQSQGSGKVWTLLTVQGQQAVLGPCGACL